MSQMTDEEIINILENCIKRRCEHCFQFGMYEDDMDCMRRAMENALDLINHQKAENAELQRQLDAVSKEHEKEKIKSF